MMNHMINFAIGVVIFFAPFLSSVLIDRSIIAFARVFHARRKEEKGPPFYCSRERLIMRVRKSP